MTCRRCKKEVEREKPSDWIEGRYQKIWPEYDADNDRAWIQAILDYLDYQAMPMLCDSCSRDGVE